MDARIAIYEEYAKILINGGLSATKLLEVHLTVRPPQVLHTLRAHIHTHSTPRRRLTSSTAPPTCTTTPSTRARAGPSRRRMGAVRIRIPPTRSSTANSTSSRGPSSHRAWRHPTAATSCTGVRCPHPRTRRPTARLERAPLPVQAHSTGGAGSRNLAPRLATT